MFTLGFPPVPFSITNANVDKRFAKDTSTPFTLLEFIKNVSNLVESNNITTYYNHYVTTWNRYKTKQSTTSEAMIVESYRAFVKDLTLNYNSQAENKFLANIDYSDPYDLDVATKFISSKIKSIALYYRDKREDVKLETTRKKYKASNKGFVISIKERIIEFLNNTNNRTVIEDIDTIAKNLTVKVDSLYDAEAGYFNRQPDPYTYGLYDRDYAEDIFLKDNSELITKIFAGIDIQEQSLQEVSTLFDTKRALTEKYMGTDFYYLSATQTLSSVPVLNVKSDSTIRYNREFIKVLTTTISPSAITTVAPGVTISPVVTTRPPTLATTTPAPLSPGFTTEDRKYDCVNNTCVRRKDGKYETKAKCQSECKPGGGDGGNGGGDQPPDGGGGKGKCGCGNIKVVRTSTSRESSQYPDCIDKGVKDIWKFQDSIQWDCEDPNYKVEITIASDGGAEITEPKFPVTLTQKSNVSVTGTVDVGCRGKSDPQKKKIGAQYRFIFTYIPTNSYDGICYKGPEDDLPANVIDCCQLDEAPTPPEPPQDPDTPPTPDTPSTPDATSDCPECDDVDDDPDDDPPPTDPTTSGEPCPPCPTDSGTSSGSAPLSGKSKPIDDSPPSNPPTPPSPSNTITPPVTGSPTPPVSGTETPSLS